MKLYYIINILLYVNMDDEKKTKCRSINVLFLDFTFNTVDRVFVRTPQGYAHKKC